MTYKQILTRTTLFLLTYSLFVACGDLSNIGGGSLGGTIYGKDFNLFTGSAERGGAGQNQFSITLADVEELECGSTKELPSTYLYIGISSIGKDAPQEIPAAGNVFFNNVENSVGEVSGATSGTVTIESVSAFRISGKINASGPDGNVSGSFSADICN